MTDLAKSGGLLGDLDLGAVKNKRADSNDRKESNDSTKVIYDGEAKSKLNNKKKPARRRQLSFSPEGRKGKKNNMGVADDLVFDFKAPLRDEDDTEL